MPVLTVTDMTNGKTDLNSVEDCVNSSSSTFSTRLGGTKLSLSGAISNIVHGTISAYSSGTTYTDVNVWVEQSGIVYRPLPSALPIGPEAFDSSKWIVVQGYKAGDRLIPGVSSYDDVRNIITTGLTTGTPLFVTNSGIAGDFVLKTGATANDITNVTQANPAVVTYSGADNWSNGDTVHIQKVAGMTELNGNRYTVANVNTGANTFELSGVDSSAYTAYSSGGVVSNDNGGTIIVIDSDWYAERGYRGSAETDWFETVGDNSTENYTTMQAAFDFAMDGYQRLAGGLGGSFPSIRRSLQLGEGVYRVSSTLTIIRTSLACFRLKSPATSTIYYTGTSGACLYAQGSASQGLLTTRVELENIHLLENGKSIGTIGLDLERTTNARIAGLSTYGFDYGVQINGAIDCHLDFQGEAIEGCNIGIQVEQDTGAVGGPQRPNLTKIENLYLIDCATNGIVLRENPGESTPNSFGGLIELNHINFQCASSGPALFIDNAGEISGQGSVKGSHLWFEGHGLTAISITDAIVHIDKLFITNAAGGGTPTPIILNDTTSKIIIDELDCFFSVTPTDNCVIRRADGTTDGLWKQVIVRNSKIGVDIVSTVNLTKDNVVPLTSSYFSLIQTDRILSEQGTTSSIAGSGGTVDIFDMSTESGCWYVFVKQSDGGIAWRAEASVFHDGAATSSVDTKVSANVTVTVATTSIRLTNTNASAQAFSWTILRVL